jgi:CDP-glycerol glycerophosphotransferase (TagB/SpsB family)
MRLFKYIRIFFRIFLWPLYWLSGFFPRDPNIWAFGCQKNGFNDNPKYFYLYINENHKDIRAIWLSHDKNIIKQLRNRGFAAFNKTSLKGIYFILRSKYYFFNSSPNDINYFLSRKAVLFNLWHGIPLKKIEFDIKKGPLAKKYNKNRTISRIIYKIFSPDIYLKPDYVLSTSDLSSNLFSSAFRINKKQCIECGYPRNDIFKYPFEKIENFIRQYEDEKLYEIIQGFKNFNRIFIYMPTWRDNELNIIEKSGINLERLNDILKQKNYYFLLKLHISTNIRIDNARQFSNIFLIDNTIDIYPLLPYVHTLITDYSSIFFDFLLLNKEIIFFPFDYDNYINENRELYFKYEEITPGIKAYTFSQLLEIINRIEDIDYSSKRYELKKKLWQTSTLESSECIYNKIKNISKG